MIKKIFKLTIGIALIIFLKIIGLFVLIRIAHCHTGRIGHLCGNIDNYLSIRSSKEIAIFIKANHVSNKEILKKWSQVSRIFFINRKFSWVFGSIHYVNSDSDHIISWEKELSPKFHLNSISPKNFYLSDEEVKKYRLNGDDFLNKKIICLHNRDEAYLKSIGSDGNFHKYRNFSFQDFRYTIDQLSSKNFKFVRIGRIVENKYEGNYVDKTEENGSDYDDLMLIAKSEFIVGCNSGIETVSRILRKPQVLVNYIPFNPNEMIAWGSNSTMIFKRIYDEGLGRYLTFKEMFLLNMDFDIHHKGNYFKDNGLLVEDNTPEEIFDAIQEHIERMNGNWKDNKEQSRLQKDLKASLSFNREFIEVFDKLGTKISSKFLEKNKHLV